jgi:tetratricopeptide (TPR) repeat protein
LDDVVSQALGIRGFLQNDVDIVGSLHAYREGLALARRIGNRVSVLRTVNNLGYTAFLTGDWDEALEHLDGQLTEDLERADRIALLANSVIVHACRGEDIAERLTELRRLLDEDPLRSSTAGVDDAIGNAAMAGGRLRDARTAWQHLADQDAINAPEFTYRAARPALWEGDVEAARTDLAALDATGVHGSVVELRRTTLRAGIAALEGRPADALAQYREALRGWHDLGLAWDGALTGIDMAMLLGPSVPEVAAAAETTRAMLSRVGAWPFVERLDAAMAGTPAAPSSPAGVADAVDAPPGAPLAAR